MILNLRKRQKPSQAAAAIVTGAAHGIGRSFAQEIVKRGGSVICVDIDKASAEQTASELSEVGEGRAIAYQCDVGKEKQMQKLSEEAELLLGRPVTLLVNNAGIAAAGAMGEASLKDWHTVINVNLWGVIHGCHFFVPKLRELGYGGIINVASAAGFMSIPQTGAYCASKSAVMALSETLAAELAGTNIHVTMLCPTAVNTDILDRGLLPEGVNEFTNWIKDNWIFVAKPDNVARETLDALDAKKLYVMPQFDSRLAWRLKRYIPRLYARTLGEVHRIGSG